MLKKVCDIMNKEVFTVTPWVSVGIAAEIMEQFRVSGLPVIEDGRLLGIITSRDIRRTHSNRLVADAMTHTPVAAVSPQSSLWQAKELLEQHQIERLLVVEDGSVIGMITETKLYAELGKHMDAMTELPRGEYLYQKAVDLLHKYQDIAIIFIDIDNFGEIDKAHGHVVGDHVLWQVGNILKQNIPVTDCLCRYGGDEFALVWPSDNAEARKLAYVLVDKIDQTVYSNDIRLSASAGVSGGRRAGKRPGEKTLSTVKDLVNMASLASSNAKRQKSRVMVADSVCFI